MSNYDERHTIWVSQLLIARMQRIVWTPAFSVGEAELDGHHQYLADLINHLADHLEAPRAAAAVDDILAGVLGYAAFHFKAEELCLARCGFPDLVAHQAEHRHFYEAMTELRYGASLGLVDLGRLFAYLCRWWTQHIQGEDQQYKPYLAANPSRVAIPVRSTDDPGGRGRSVPTR